MQQLRVFLYGIKGSGMAALALYLQDFGLEVAGADVPEELFTELALRERRIRIYRFDEIGLDELSRYDIAVYSSAFSDRPLIAEAREKMPCFEYHCFVADLLKDQEVIGVAGTHGKTTLVGLLNQMLCDVNVIEGDGYGRYLGARRTVLEACEYRDHYLAYRPKLAVITAIELDHTDYFSSYKDYVDSFVRFAGNSKQTLVYDIYAQHFPQALTFGALPTSPFRYAVKRKDESGFKVDFAFPDGRVLTAELPFFGDHMVKLTLAALAVGYLNGYELEPMLKRLAHYQPVKRRLNIERRGCDCYIDDYAHQPSQIENMLKVARQLSPHNRLVAIFLPDRLSRLRDFYSEFKRTLELFDEAYLVFRDPAKEELERRMIDESVRIKSWNEKVGSGGEPTTFLFLSSKKISDLIEIVKANRTVRGR